MTQPQQKLIFLEEIFKQSWNLFKKNYVQWLIPNLLLMALSFFLVLILVIIIFFAIWLVGIYSGDIYNYNLTFFLIFITVLFLLILLFLIFATIITSIISLRILLNLDENKSLKVLIFQALKIFWPYLGLTILLSLILGISYLFFIIPGIIFSIFLLFSFFVILEKPKEGIRGSLKTSWNLVKGYFWPLFGRLILFALIYSTLMSFLSFIPVISLAVYFFLVPYYLCILVVLYQDLKKIKMT